MKILASVPTLNQRRKEQGRKALTASDIALTTANAQYYRNDGRAANKLYRYAFHLSVIRELLL